MGGRKEEILTSLENNCSLKSSPIILGITFWSEFSGVRAGCLLGLLGFLDDQ